jgi:hypothetical protein
MSSSAPKEEDIFGILRPRLAKALVGFSRDLPQDWDQQHLENRTRPARTEFPVPELVLFALRNVLGFRCIGPEEKVRWSVYCTFNQVLVSLELQKSGFTICAAKGASIDLDRLCGQLCVAVKHVEHWLEPRANAWVAEGNVTIANRHYEFDSRYLFFRKRADRAYLRADHKLRRKSESVTTGDLLSGSRRATRRGFYYSTAMIDAFFSRLEHHLVLLRAFAGDPLTDGQLPKFLSDRWGDKLVALIDVGEPAMLKLYSELKRIKERIRNPFAHGAIENDHGSLFVHIPTVGALPANFTRIRHSVRFNFVPVGKEDHRSACAVFDAFDKAMRTGSRSGAYSFIEAGIHPSFDVDTLAAYKRLSVAPANERQEWFERWHDEDDRHRNMED